jgi:1,4-alpha-glucan branching enzyme
VPNEFGGRENLEALAFLKELNEITHRACPGIMMIAEESTAWPMVSRPLYDGGLGFDFKWNMGWMHDTLKYFQTDPLFRAGNHNALTFGLVYAWSENFILPFSHDEVVHMKGSLLNKMPGTTEQKFATLRALYAYMWAHPGKKLLFMGGEFGQWREWTETESLDWHLVDKPLHGGVQRLVRDLNLVYGPEPELWEADGEHAGFEWIDVDNARENIVAFKRRSPQTGRELICVCNFSAVTRKGYRVSQLDDAQYELIINTDADVYGGSGALSVDGSDLDLPPLTTLWFAPQKSTKQNRTRKGTQKKQQVK